MGTGGKKKVDNPGSNVVILIYWRPLLYSEFEKLSKKKAEKQCVFCFSAVLIFYVLSFIGACLRRARNTPKESFI
jgi:hypothetical protein